ncbi:hypothetical protein N7449_003501 [Penicillium cf. viridicatum]|uniref:Uncharacterized protein n=1 Tax=Penicillium cf. viridicatum TaxID=2972119 RepID=A0A9W9MXC2_9EURO|nr:hypothetical protein N7449_003501 [Penicillium cf. viridicatum]
MTESQPFYTDPRASGFPAAFAAWNVAPFRLRCSWLARLPLRSTSSGTRKKYPITPRRTGDHRRVPFVAWYSHSGFGAANRNPPFRLPRLVAERLPVPQFIELDGSPERFAQFSLSKHKSADTEDRVHHWYGAVQNFRRSVSRLVEQGCRGSAA